MSSYTTALIVDDEKADTLRSALIISTSFLRANPCTIRVDTSPGFLALRNDDMLNSLGIQIDFGRIKNKDSNSVIDKGIQELEIEFLKHGASECLTHLQLQLSIDTLNSRIRNRGFSAKEIILKRDQFTNTNIEVSDQKLSQEQQAKRAQNHLSSSLSKAGTKSTISRVVATVGDLVFIKHEKQKHKLRDRFIVTKIEGPNASIQKLNEKFMSRQYVVPITRLYLAQPSTNSDSDNVPVQSDFKVKPTIH